jgi:hypothetical protein
MSMTSNAFDPAVDNLIIASRKEIVFIEDNVAGYETIAAHAGAGRQVVILDSTGDGLQQIVDAVEGMSGIAAIHIVTHGTEGKIGLGTLALDQASAAEHKGLLASIGASMAAGGDILFYGCSVAAGQGAALVTQLAIATGADVAASNNATGDDGQGGDWNLEISSGRVDTAPFVDAALAAQYHELLSIAGPTTLTFDSAPHSDGTRGPAADISYTIQPGYTLKFDGHTDEVWSYLTDTTPNSYLSFSPSGTEDRITIGFTGGQIFTPSSVKVNANASSDQTLIFTGLKADGTEVTHTNVFIPAGAHIEDFVTQALSGFTNISTLVITPQAGNTIQYFQLDDLVLANVQLAPPTVAYVTSPAANGTYKIGDQIDIQVNFDSAVDVAGTPQLTLETGATDRVINYVSGTGTSTLTFRYTVQAGDTTSDLDYKGSAIALNGGTIKVHGGGTDADLTLPAPGNIGSLSPNKAIVIDGIVPTLSITSDKTVLKAGETAEITFTFSEDPGSSFDGSDVTLNGGTLSAISTSGLSRTAVFTPTADIDLGTASISVGAGKYKDAAGNSNTTASNGPAITYDTLAPTTTTGATLSVDTGASTTDMITQEATQTVSGTLSASLAAGERVMVSLDNGASWNPATASVGSTTWELPATLSGSNTLKVKVVDLAGNDGAVYSHAYTLDKAPPAAPSTPDLDAGSDSGASDSDDITAVTLPTFSGTAEVGAKVTLFDGGIEIGSVVAVDGTWQITTSNATPMNQRTHFITAIATDLAGNSGTNSSALQVQVFTNAPATTIASIALSSDANVDGDFITKAPNQTISGTLSASLAAGERVQVSVDGGASWNNAASAAGSNTWSIAATLTEGSHAGGIQVRVIDAVDNFGPVLTQDYTLDTAPPTVSITSSAAQLKAGETATITFTFSEDPGTSFSWDGSAGSVTVSGGTLSAIIGTGTTRTAVFTPAANVNGDTASISIGAGTYHDLAGNDGLAGVTPSITFDTLAPVAPSRPDLDKDSDSGALDTDNRTSATELVFKGSAEAGATVRLYDSDGTTEIGHATATGGNWTITTSTLLDGDHTVTAKAFDAAGNASTASSPITVTVDTTKPAAMAAPALAAGSDSGAAGDGITKVAKPTIEGSAEAFAQVTLYDGAVVLGTASADGAGVWEFTPGTGLPDGVHTISARQVDGAGNQSDAGAAFSLTVDTVAPAAPAAPLLKASSDTDTLGDGITENDRPVIEGTALANTLVTLYDDLGRGQVRIGTATADAGGKWSIAPGLSVGSHKLTVTQSDAAGNESAASAVFALRIDAPPVPTTPTTLIDGVAVDIQPISLPGGVIGSAVTIPIVSAGRTDSSGHAGVADIPLLTSNQGANLLLAQLPAGFGLSASGASAPAANGAELLLAAIRAATPSHGAADQGHLTGNGQSFLAGLASSGTLLVETVKPVSAANAPDGVLTLSGPLQPLGQSTALVIDTGGLAAGATIALQQVNFAAVIGAANVVSTGGAILSGDGASQHFTVTAAAGATAVLAGGGDDILTLGSTSAGAGAVMLHGGAAADVAAFSGARADYTLAFHNGYVTVTGNSGPATATTVVNVETLKFSDGSVAVQNSADMGTLAGIYQTVLGRQADLYGIEYWANVHQAGASWGTIALAIIGSTEKTSGHEGFNGVAAHDLTLLYTALFDRTPDAAGLAYWTDAMAHGLSLEQVASGFVQSVEMVGHQRAAPDWDFSVG